MLNKIINLMLVALASLFLFGCGEGESEVAKNIKLKVSSGAVVVPTTLEDTDSLCNDSDIEGPRVRMRSSIIWSGSKFGNLYPTTITAIIENSQLSGTYEEAKGPQGDDETVSSYFGLSTDYIPPDGEIYSSADCYLDWGGLPRPKNKLSGRAELRTRGKVILTGIARTDSGTEAPFVKEAKFEIKYVVGSAPSD